MIRFLPLLRVRERRRGGPGTIPGMPAPIDIAKVARLARLALTTEEMERYGAQLGAILEHAASIQAVATEGVLPTAHPLPMLNAMRPDEVEETLDREEVLEQAPDREGPYFRVPPFMEEA